MRQTYLKCLSHDPVRRPSGLHDYLIRGAVMVDGEIVHEDFEIVDGGYGDQDVIHAGLMAIGERYREPKFFIDTLTTTGDGYMISADRRAEWDAFDIACEDTSERVPLPEWARPIAAMSHVEFEMPVEIFK